MLGWVTHCNLFIKLSERNIGRSLSEQNAISHTIFSNVGRFSSFSFLVPTTSIYVSYFLKYSPCFSPVHLLQWRWPILCSVGRRHHWLPHLLFRSRFYLLLLVYILIHVVCKCDWSRVCQLVTGNLGGNFQLWETGSPLFSTDMFLV
jgi:hypothetical protein